ncbi:MAG: hypothetical protein NVSMB10_09220 [Steroidobacteraceae bacterium]
MSRRTTRWVPRAAFSALWAAWVPIASMSLPIDRPAQDRAAAPLPGESGPVSALRTHLAVGDIRLTYEGTQGYLTSLLRSLHVPVSSQTLVFSKTSSQVDLISPKTPRAIYFSDDVYVAWVPSSDVVELSEVDPIRGAVFYTVDENNGDTAVVREHTSCLRCHQGLHTQGVPGHVVMSMLTALDGRLVARVDDYQGGHRSPLRVRWAGWYVTGTCDGDSHLGNAFTTDRIDVRGTAPSTGINLTDLGSRLDIARYLAPSSDIVALLVLEHQVQMQNLLARLNREARLAPPSAADTNASLPASESFTKTADAVLLYMLFRDEAPLKGPVRGTSTFAADFSQRGPRDRRGRSLRDFDLQHRLFRFPCSYLIYSAAFDALPLEARNRLWARLMEILQGKDRSAAYATMSPADRLAIFQILADTKADFAAWVANHPA